jgi:hypothetical protein
MSDVRGRYCGSSLMVRRKDIQRLKAGLAISHLLQQATDEHASEM